MYSRDELGVVVLVEGVDVSASVVDEVVHRLLGVLRDDDLVLLLPHLDPHQRQMDVQRRVQLSRGRSFKERGINTGTECRTDSH